MNSISGTVPQILYDRIEDNKNLIAKGSDIDITVSDNGKITTLYAITLGSGKWEISELEDNANIFPKYENGDVISLDSVTKVLLSFNPTIIGSSNHIFSFNLLGKVKYGIKDIKKEADRKAGKITRFFTDEITKEEAEEYLEEFYDDVNIGNIELYKKQDGKIYKVFFGCPSEKKFYICCLYKNGNDIRQLDDDDFKDTPILSFTNGDEALEAYQNYPNTTKEEDNEEQESIFTDEIIDEILAHSHFNTYQALVYEDISTEGSSIQNAQERIVIFMVDMNDNSKYGVGIATYDGKKGILEQGQDSMTFDKAVKKYKELGGKKDIKFELNDILEDKEPIETTETSGKTEDGFEWEIVESLKKKKSKYNGKNVTGYENGMLSPMVGSRHTFSNLFMQLPQ